MRFCCHLTQRGPGLSLFLDTAAIQVYNSRLRPHFGRLSLIANCCLAQAPSRPPFPQTSKLSVFPRTPRAYLTIRNFSLVSFSLFFLICQLPRILTRLVVVMTPDDAILFLPVFPPCDSQSSLCWYSPFRLIDQPLVGSAYLPPSVVFGAFVLFLSCIPFFCQRPGFRSRPLFVLFRLALSCRNSLLHLPSPRFAVFRF